MALFSAFLQKIVMPIELMQKTAEAEAIRFTDSRTQLILLMTTESRHNVHHSFLHKRWDRWPHPG
jgi:hypothetical protein